MLQKNMDNNNTSTIVWATSKLSEDGNDEIERVLHYLFCEAPLQDETSARMAKTIIILLQSPVGLMLIRDPYIQHQLSEMLYTKDVEHVLTSCNYFLFSVCSQNVIARQYIKMLSNGHRQLIDVPFGPLDAWCVVYMYNK
jgi:hypothetical protein